MKGLPVMLAVAVLCPVSLETGAVAAEGFQKLSGSQIRARLAGMQITDERCIGATSTIATER